MTSKIKSSNGLKDFWVLIKSPPNKDESTSKLAAEKNASLTKPPGALGRLEELAIWYCAWRQNPNANILSPQVIVFAGNHGVASLGVSAFPQEVTEQMVLNFEHKGAAINQLCQVAGAKLNVHSLELEKPTKDFTKEPALSSKEFEESLLVGWSAVKQETDLLVVGEMGIGNTTSAAVLACALFGRTAREWVGRGTGVTDEGLALKIKVVEQGLERIKEESLDPFELLRQLGGREMVAMVGAIARARALKIPVIATKGRGTSKIIKNDYNGYLVDNQNIDDLIIKIEKLLFDSKVQRRFSNAGIKTIETKFNMVNVGMSFYKLYEQII